MTLEKRAAVLSLVILLLAAGVEVLVFAGLFSLLARLAVGTRQKKIV